MKRHNFIYENSHKHKIKSVFIFIVTLAVLIAIAILFFTAQLKFIQNVPIINLILVNVQSDIVNFTPVGLLYQNFIGGIFFIPTPDEILFYYALSKSHSIIIPLLFSTIGYMLAQVVNYFVGLKISGFVLNLVSKKKVYKTRRFVNKYGAPGIFLFNLLPLPGPLLIFALGIAKYNFSKLFLMTLLGKLCKYLFLILLYILIFK